VLVVVLLPQAVNILRVQAAKKSLSEIFMENEWVIASDNQ
jgi:hypothetical protein